MCIGSPGAGRETLRTSLLRMACAKVSGPRRTRRRPGDRGFDPVRLHRRDLVASSALAPCFDNGVAQWPCSDRRSFRLKCLFPSDEMIRAGYVEVGMQAVWASVCRAALVVGATSVLLGCAPERAPSALVGTWYSEDERFDGRTLEINPEWIRFMQGQNELDAIQVRAVTQEGSGEGPIHFEIAGIDRDDEDTTLSFEMELRPTQLLRLETQSVAWRRTPRGSGPKINVVPWGRTPRAPNPGEGT